MSGTPERESSWQSLPRHTEDTEHNITETLAGPRVYSTSDEQDGRTNARGDRDEKRHWREKA